MKCSAFDVDAPRFSKKTQYETPGIILAPFSHPQSSVSSIFFLFLLGPASYDLIGSIEEKMKSKRNIYAVVTHPFNQTTLRQLSRVADEEFCKPAPNEYRLQDGMNLKESKCTNSMFKSITNRFPAITRKVSRKYNTTF